jgi:RHS repeat-associated protein
LYFDCLGRPVLSVEHNRDIDTNVNIYQQTITRLDSEGNLRSVTDANGNTVMQYRYDMLGKLVWQSGMDNGQRWLLTDIMGAPLRTWDERGHTFCYYYDILHRPTCQKVQGGDGASPLDHIFDRVFYGEDLLEAERSNEAALKALNLLGKPVKQYDTAGLTSIPSYDFNGQPISTSRRLFSKYREVADWTDANLDSDLETDSYTFITQTDALGRINLQTAPDNSIIRPSYNQRGLFNGESVLYHGQTDAVTYIRGITYNEKGLRSSIDYGNEVTSSFTYDRQTFRLIRLQTIKKNGDTLQDWNYTYDPVGNIVFLEDRNIPEVFFDNHKTTGRAEYTYDAVYRLIKATGRENNVSLAFGAQDNYDDSSFAGVFHNSDPMTMRGYIQNYRYDSAGNITGMQHLSSGNNWKRDYTYETGNNRLQQTQVNDNVYTYTHHPAQGFITAMPHLSDIGWNFKEEMVRSASQRRTDGGTPETTYYQYDSNGKRIRKVTDNTAAEGEIPTRKNERIYIAGYETCRDYTGGSVSLEMESLSLIDQGNRFVMIETITHNILPSNDGSDSVGVRLTRYQFNNHQGSSSLELDDRAEVISYEEYHPFGTTSFQAKNAEIRAASKRYRYTSMERDGETGLEYHTARYYIPWLGRWVSTDPIGIRDGANLYQYAKNNPLRLADTKGTQAEQQMGFWECKAYWTDVTATYSSRGISADLRATYTGLYRMWTSDYSTKIDVGHMEKPFVFLQSGEVSKVGPQDASGNRSDGGGAVRAMSQAVKATGGFAREDGLDTSPAGLASKGLRNAPNPLPASLQDPRLIPMGKMPPPSTSPQVTSPAPSTVTTTASGSQQLHFSFVEDESPQLSFNFNKPAPSPAPATGPAQEQLQFDFTKPAAPAAPAPKPAAPAAPKSSPTSSGSSQESGTSLAPGGGAGAGTLGAVGRNVPFVAEAESVLISGSYAAAPYSAAASTYLMATAEALPVAAGVGVVGVGAGHAARYTATQLGASEATANSIGLGAAIVTGAAIGSVIPGVGTAVGAGIGAVVAGGMYLWSL